VTAVDRTSLRVDSILLAAARRAYVGPDALVRCTCCGAVTTERDAYPVETPFGDVTLCTPCNVNPFTWEVDGDVLSADALALAAGSLA
jgi:hypothetical protein